MNAFILFFCSIVFKCSNVWFMLLYISLYGYLHFIFILSSFQRELSELLDRRRRRTGERERRLEFRLLIGDLPPLLNRCGDRLHPRRIGIGGLGFGSKIGATVTSCPSICPPSICFMAFSASSEFTYSMYANPLPNF